MVKVSEAKTWALDVLFVRCSRGSLAMNLARSPTGVFDSVPALGRRRSAGELLARKRRRNKLDEGATYCS